MASWLVRAYLAALRVSGALRRYWKRLLVGAFAGWLVSTVLGAFLVVWLEASGLVSAQTTPVLAAAFVWSGIGLGALLAYAVRPRAREAAAPRTHRRPRSA
ncbi:MAG TPA: hypothetical protein VNJ46_08080 [Gaiellaceae bacterium]|nr:hypothetical protein [Gaiellaceae bacterium]